MRYTVTYTDSITGTENSRWFDFPGTYAHSSHMKEILLSLDEESLDLVSIAVTKDETVEAIMNLLHQSPWERAMEDAHDINRLYN